MRILGIETSCDETAVALFEGDVQTGQGHIMAESVRTQIDIHARFGGVVPEIASREHLSVLPRMVDTLFEDAQLSWQAIDLIAVTAGPGLMGGLLVGVSYAQAVALANEIEVMPIHHMEGHLLAPGLEGDLPSFPFITLLVSGGHTMLVRVDGIGKYKVLGQTIDDAAGECFDKSARVLGLPYPGGPEVSKLALKGDANAFRMPRPLLHKDNLDFSFSGLKTAVMYAAKDTDLSCQQTRSDLAAAVEEAICDVLVKKSMRACKQQGVSSLLIAGGVAANQTLRKLLAEAGGQRVQVYFPSLQYCTDNAAMIAYAGFWRKKQGWQEKNDWDVHPRWSLTELGL